MRSRQKLAFAVATVTAALALTASGEARASLTVTYSTSGTFGSSGTNEIVLGTGSSKPQIDVIFTGTTQTNLGVPDLTAPFGSFSATVVSTGNANRPVSDTFSLVLTQTDPTNGSHTFSSTVNGSINLGANNVVTITFTSPLSTTFDTITYTVPATVTLASPSDTVGANTSASVTGTITVAAPPAAPEPSTMVYGGTAALFGLASAWRRRRNATA